jgi:hypothetical protein
MLFCVRNRGGCWGETSLVAEALWGDTGALTLLRHFLFKHLPLKHSSLTHINY